MDDSEKEQSVHPEVWVQVEAVVAPAVLQIKQLQEQRRQLAYGDGLLAVLLPVPRLAQQ